MTEQDKQLLIKDLCARLPYVTYIRIVEPDCLDKNESVTEGCIGGYANTNMCEDYSMDEVFESIESEYIVQPYLRPMADMTEKEYETFPIPFSFDSFSTWNNTILSKVIEGTQILIGIDEITEIIDWLNARHFDYRGLIGKGLALEAPEGMYKTKAE